MYGRRQENQILRFHSIPKAAEEAIDHRVVNGDAFFRTMPGAILGLRDN